mmetsp:Transcript_866/g.1435  ORF Transcript_866/g.1435 Transcript_866/m.1435 type:complete len:571 (+) Transcript_866:90-1802(+)|eukprot:CAMPEP_0119340200 /NCGR_PEP_ID=MMETSP1333-20130426/99855_1 /TAXON_ID=418940 /ORGANISM="Scyphosphaera apsteinii, Strain RCC1455" /LENGTH=570 /DNA_ID=CAMNT_0007351891 /DNA_START=86 /DNA_END=1798 /DNA_ORIENTATION=+
MIRLHGEALEVCTRKLQEDLQAACEWKDQYQIFELTLRHQFYGEPRARENADAASRFYPKLKPLREALLIWEERKIQQKAFDSESHSGSVTAHGGDSTCSIGKGEGRVFANLVPAILHAACVPDLPAECKPLVANEQRDVPRSLVAAYLANAFILNWPHGSALDFYGGGKDPLYVSGAKLAVQKLLCLLAYFEQAAAQLETMQPRLEVKAEEVKAKEDCVRYARVSDKEEGAPWVSADELEMEFVLSFSDAMVVLPQTEVHHASSDATCIFSSLSFGGGPLSGLSATQEEIVTLCFSEALLGLFLLAEPMAPAEALLLQGVRRYSRCEGAAHLMRFHSAVHSSGTSQLIAINSSSPPGPAQFAVTHILADLKKALVGFTALRHAACHAPTACHAAAAAPRHGISALHDGHIGEHTAQQVVVPTLASGLWGCEGFQGGQPLLRMVVQLIAALTAGIRVQFCLPIGCEPKWFRGVLAECARHHPSAAQIITIACAEPARRSPCFSADIPKYASLLIKTLRSSCSAATTHVQAVGERVLTTGQSVHAASECRDEDSQSPQPLKRHKVGGGEGE